MPPFAMLLNPSTHSSLRGGRRQGSCSCLLLLAGAAACHAAEGSRDAHINAEQACWRHRSHGLLAAARAPAAAPATASHAGSAAHLGLRGRWTDVGRVRAGREALDSRPGTALQALVGP